MPDKSPKAAIHEVPEGCAQVPANGFRGRMGIVEIFKIDDEVRGMINGADFQSQLRKRARELGMRTLREDGIRKVLAGMTTAEEVIDHHDDATLSLGYRIPSYVPHDHVRSDRRLAQCSRRAQAPACSKKPPLTGQGRSRTSWSSTASSSPKTEFCAPSPRARRRSTSI